MADVSYLGVHAVSVYVRDQEESLRFYVDRLGFDVAFDAVQPNGVRWVAVSPPDGSTVLTLIAPSPESHAAALIGRPTGVAFVTEDVVAKYGEWRRRGVRFQYTPRLRRVKLDGGIPEDSANPWGGVFTHFRDPDGNSFMLAGFDEVSRKIEARKREQAQKAEAERRAAQELEIARSVQARFFPQSQPPVATLDYAGACIQARQVGGDYYDFLDLGDDRCGLVIGDIAGKGIAAALLMSNLQAILRLQSDTLMDRPRNMLRAVNGAFHKNTAESAYATLFFGEYDDDTRHLRYANCGHLPGLLLRRGGAVERLESTATVLGLFREWDCAVEERCLSPGDMLAIYTDGITESFNDADEEFGEARLVDALRRHEHLEPQSMIAAVVDEVRRFSSEEQHDDITLAVARCR